MDEIYFALCKESDTPVSLSAWLRYKYDHKSFLEMEFRPGDYLEKDTDRFKRDYAVCSILSKWKGLNSGVNLESVALQKFDTSEVECRQTNLRLRVSRRSPIQEDLAGWIFRSRVKIAKLLGPFSLHCVSPFFGWGPGATHDITRRRAQVDKKMTTVPMTVSGGAIELLESVIRQDLHWSCAILGVMPEGPFSFTADCFLRTDTCKVKTVPKSAKTDRVIAIEPTGNLFLQKGVGGYFRRRLKQHGIDLDDQAVNQDLARNALNCGLATLDLKAASDTVSRELVYELLPVDWAFFMDAIRSRRALKPDGTEIELEKWSSMGNGYTFELETLIFWALATSVLESKSPWGTFSVYGDDIVISKECAPDLVRLLEFVGFTVNKEKSFLDGLFYESCGKHYFNGHDVTPLYQKEPLHGSVELIRLHNRIVRWSDRVLCVTQSHRPAYRASSERFQRCLIPYGVEGDDGFLAPLEDLLALRYAHDSNRGIRCRVVQSFPRSLPGIEMALLAHRLRFGQYHGKVSAMDYRDDFVMEGEPSYGDIELAGLEESTSDLDALIGHRWVIPTGYCPLPRR
jgi:hypothetical protein